MNSNKNWRFIRLDLIRIISCISILLYHLNILKSGFLAVCTFFTLSGYLECRSSLNKKEFSIKKYYYNKIRKLYLPLALVTSITVIAIKAMPFINWINLKYETLSVIFGYNNIWQTSANLDYFAKHINSPFMHLWYIAILIQFVILFPVIFLFLKTLDEKINNHISTVFVSILLISSTIYFIFLSYTQDIMIVYYNSFARSFSIFFGIMLGIMHSKYHINLSKLFSNYHDLVFLLYLLLLIIMFIFVPSNSNFYSIYMIIATIISVRLIEYSIVYDEMQVTKLNAVLEFLSNLSYEVYLVQYPIIFILQSISMDNKERIALIVSLTFIIAFILNKILKKFTEKKIVNILVYIILLSGLAVVILEKDISLEMEELKNRLEENSKIAEELNNEYLETSAENLKNEENELDEENSNQLGETNEIDETYVEDIVHNLQVVGIGDSILLSAVNDLFKYFPNGYFDGKISRSIISSKELLNDLKEQGKLGDVVILSLANNGEYSTKRCTELLDILEDREIFWVNAVGADDPEFNERFEKFTQDYPNLHIVDWYSIGNGNEELLYPDKIHPKEGVGTAEYARVIYETIYNYYLEKYKVYN